MTYQLVKNRTQPLPIDDCDNRNYCYRYHVTLLSMISDKQEIIDTLQQDMFDHGESPAAFFFIAGKEPAHEDVRGLWVWHAVFDRPDCESDFHVCYMDEGHVGHDKAAIAQLQGEIDEAMPLNSRIRNVKVIDRAVLHASDDYPAWKPENVDLMLKREAA